MAQSSNEEAEARVETGSIRRRQAATRSSVDVRIDIVIHNVVALDAGKQISFLRQHLCIDLDEAHVRFEQLFFLFDKGTDGLNKGKAERKKGQQISTSRMNNRRNSRQREKSSQQKGQAELPKPGAEASKKINTETPTRPRLSRVCATLSGATDGLGRT